jgi:hypothetical protein
VCTVEERHVPLAKRLHQIGKAIGLSRRHEQVNVIRHEDVRMHCAFVLLRVHFQQVEVYASVLVIEEARRAIHSSLNDVGRAARDL